MEDYRQKTKEELAEEYRIETEQKNFIERNADDLDFLHKKAEEIFYSNDYSEWAWDSVFNRVLICIEDHHNPASLPVLLRLCDDDRFWASVFKDGWLSMFRFGYEKEDLIREYFKNLHEIFPRASEMGASIYSIIAKNNIELQKKCVLLAQPEAFRQLCSMFLEPQDIGWVPLGSDEEEFEMTQNNIRILEKYYDAHRLQVV